jgi:translation elongation factor EF-Ts
MSQRKEETIGEINCQSDVIEKEDPLAFYTMHSTAHRVEVLERIRLKEEGIQNEKNYNKKTNKTLLTLPTISRISYYPTKNIRLLF